MAVTDMSKRIGKTETGGAPGFSDSAAGEAPRENPAGPAKLVKRLRLGPGGRVVIPASFRKAMKIDEGDAVTAILEDGELRLIGSDAALRKVQALVGTYVPEGESLVDALIRERRREARKESRGG